MIIGLTGGIGSGKSTAAEYFSGKGFTIIDVDGVARDIVEPGGGAYREVVSAFGCVSKDGHIDRRALANIVFNDDNALKKLNSIVHPRVHGEISRLLGESTGDVVIYCALLIEAGYVPMCDKVMLITANDELRIKRVAKRNQITDDEARARLTAQNSDEFRIPYADIVIANDGDTLEFICKLDAFIGEYL